MPGYKRESSFYKVTFHWVDASSGQPVVCNAVEFHPGQNIGIVRQYFGGDLGVLIDTQPEWFDLLDIVDTDHGVGFAFQTGVVDASKPGFGYLRERYDDFVQARDDAHRQDY